MKDMKIMRKFKQSKTYRQLSRVTALLLLLSMCFAYGSGITALAAVDLDVTIIPPDDTVQNGHYCDVGLQMVTKSANGYVEMVINIEYDADLLALSSPVNEDGYKITGSKGQLTLTYFDPTGTNTPTPIGNDKTITIRFIVLENAPDTTTKIKANIDHAYNEHGKNVTWTPIYDKEIEIIRINESVSSEATSSEEESSQFVVGKNTGTVSRSSSGTGNGGKVASVIIGAIVIFAAGMAAGYIMCMKKYESTGAKPAPKTAKTASPKKPKPKRRDSRDDYYDDYDDDYYDDYEYKSRSVKRSSVDEYADYDNEDGFYTKPQEESGAGGDYLGISAENGASGNYPDSFATPIGSRSISTEEFTNIIDGKAKLAPPDDDDDDYPILFMTRDNGGSATSARRSSRQTRPVFDEDEDTIFGKFTDNVERNVDDGYGGLSSNRRDRSERSRRNR